MSSYEKRICLECGLLDLCFITEKQLQCPNCDSMLYFPTIPIFNKHFKGKDESLDRYLRTRNGELI